MIVLEAVVEVRTPEWTPPWPVAPMDAGSWLVLDAHRTDEELGLFVTILAAALDVPPPTGGVSVPRPAGGDGVPAPVGGDSVPAPTRGDEILDALLAEELLIAPGGLRIRDTGTGVSIVPGCCAGLEDWRDWTQSGAFLGHDPGPELEPLHDRLRIWQDGGPGRHEGPWAGTFVDLPHPDLPALTDAVHHDLLSFLDLLTAWMAKVGLGRKGTALAAAIDRDFAIRTG